VINFFPERNMKLAKTLKLIRHNGLNEIVSIMPAVDEQQVKRSLSYQDYLDRCADEGRRPSDLEWRRFFAEQEMASDDDGPGAA
jgi:hypothetical protein